ncbi:VSP [Giardia lamblia P15]|uniref:VSP n=1 Tax=Giardia intestinalis (strain P15) TaxID=658858 RepID=E1F9N1_GIAIA|nr:VSP [Giardia lamblia P15]
MMLVILTDGSRRRVFSPEHAPLSLEPYHDLCYTTMLLVAFYFAISTLAEACQPDGDHAVTCQTDKCETVGDAEICTQCKAGGVPIDGFCWPFNAPQVVLAGCTGKDGADLASSATVCEKCDSGYFLFMGGCFKKGSESSQTLGDSICETAQDGRCTKCKADGNVFQNNADTVTLGNECVLCSDITQRDGVMGVAKCLQCTAPNSKKGAATCTACADGSFVSNKACVDCNQNCATCTGSTQNECASCKDGKYLKEDTHTCVAGTGDTCGANNYADKRTWRCKSCTEITDCDTCVYDEQLNGPKCKTCGSSKIVQTEIDGRASCVELNTCTENGQPGTHFRSDGNKKCIACSDTTTEVAQKDQGIAKCKTCTKADGATQPVCSVCLDGFYFDTTCKPCERNCKTCSAQNTCIDCIDGYFLNINACAEKCAEHCATCKKAGDINACTKCMPGYFLIDSTEGIKECALCTEVSKGGREGCSACSNTGGFKCTDCKANYQKEGSPDNCACRKTCEDETACGGTAGACDAKIVDSTGKTLNYCSLCGNPAAFPIDGKCTASKEGNQCSQGVCTQCAQGYFLYMGGCYSTANPPGNLMCKTANGGICTEAASDKYFAVFGAAKTDQSVLACGNPLGTAVGEKTYVGVLDCIACTGPEALVTDGMAAATCTACGEGRKPNKSGTGCAACSDANCRHCRVDGVCEECSSGFSLEGGKCVSTGGPNLSTGAIAGISVAAIVVVGGLVGFLCWWFICRGKA